MRELDKSLIRARAELKLKPGDIYEDCAFYPVLCMGVDYVEDEIWGISLIDGSQPRSCSLLHCSVRKITPEEAWAIKEKEPADPEASERIKEKWWK